MIVSVTAYIGSYGYSFLFSVNDFDPDWKTSANTGWMFCSKTDGPEKIKPASFGSPLTFSAVSQEVFTYSVKYLSI